MLQSKGAHAYHLFSNSAGKKYTYKQTKNNPEGLANTLKSKHVDFAFPVKFTWLIIILKDSAKQIIGIKLFWKSAKITRCTYKDS